MAQTEMAHLFGTARHPDVPVAHPSDRLAAESGASPDGRGRRQGQPGRPSGARLIANARLLAKPLRIGPGVIRAGLHAAGQGLGEHVCGGGLELAAEQADGAARLQCQGPPALAAGADLGEFYLAPWLVAPLPGARAVRPRLRGRGRRSAPVGATPGPKACEDHRGLAGGCVGCGRSPSVLGAGGGQPLVEPDGLVSVVPPRGEQLHGQVDVVDACGAQVRPARASSGSPPRRCGP